VHGSRDQILGISVLYSNRCVWGGAQVKILFPGGVYDTKYLAQFFPKLFPATSLEDLHTSLVPKEDDVKDEDSEDGEECNEHPASVPGAVHLNKNQQSTSANPESVVHNVNGGGSMEPSTLQLHEGTRSAHVILADLSPCKSICFHLGRVSGNIYVWLVLCLGHFLVVVLVVTS